MKKLLLKIFFIIIIFYASAIKADDNFSFKTGILKDFLSGEILYEKNPNQSIYPASMTKIMTAIIAFELIKKGDLSLDEKFFVSEKAWTLSTSGYSSMFIMPGDEISVENLLRGIIVASGTDACVALAEGIAGTEEEFSIIMTAKAKEIGMENTNFANASGIVDKDNYSTVKDILIMSNYLIKNYPEFYKMFKEKEFTWDRTGGDPITQGNRNPLLYKNIGADGIKTGFLTVEKYSLASSMKVGNRRISAVGSGFKTKNSRSRESIKLLNWGLRSFDTVKIAIKDQPIENLKVWLGKSENVPIIVKEDIFVTVPKRKKNTVKAILEYNGPIKAPIAKGDKLGVLNIFISGELKHEIDFYSSENIKRANIFSRLLKSFGFLVWGDV